MATIAFDLNGVKTKIQCEKQDKFKDICKKLISKVEFDVTKVYFIYNGNKVDEELTFQEIINETDKENNSINVLVQEIDQDIMNECYIKSNEIICPKCYESIRINLKDYKVSLYDCKNGHKEDNLSLTEFEKSQNIDLFKIICDMCKINNKAETYNHEFYKCLSCNLNLCPLCKSNHDKEHKIITYEKKYYFCNIHKDLFTKYCIECKQNICLLCEKEHKNHKGIYFGDIMNEKEELMKEMNEFRKKLDIFINTIKDIMKRLNNVIENMELYFKMNNDTIDLYKTENRNYQILNNIIEFQNYNKIIIKDIKEINDENNISNKFKYIINIYNKMNNILNEIENNKLKKEIISEYIDKKTYKFEKGPQNLKYQLDIDCINKGEGYNDIFEVFVSYRDSKEYLVTRNFSNNNLDIFSLLDNKKVNSLKGHKYHITTIRYFINNKDNNEYLISADAGFRIIVWDVTNNYKIKYNLFNVFRIGHKMWSLLLVFPNNNNNNYIIISSSSVILSPIMSSTEVISLNDGQFIKYFKNIGNPVWFLLSWYNKRNNQNYIIQLANKKIYINNLLEDELYCELINKPENSQYSGFIYNNDNNDYLCTSTNNGFIIIWDLYNKNIYKSIDIKLSIKPEDSTEVKQYSSVIGQKEKKFKLYHIIQWNKKYIIVGCGYKYFYIVDLEDEKVVSQIKAHEKEVICVKKINHPIYGESLLSSSRDEKIKLWTI